MLIKCARCGYQASWSGREIHHELLDYRDLCPWLRDELDSKRDAGLPSINRPDFQEAMQRLPRRK